MMSFIPFSDEFSVFILLILSLKMRLKTGNRLGFYVLLNAFLTIKSSCLKYRKPLCKGYSKLALIFLCFFPSIVLAEQNSNLSFAPPASDLSVVFLGNLFGVVDGVLHGTGSQIMGAMFLVFNSAVLALGGIIIMYTLIVSTMNTAHEGQMLGQKWSSIWIPVRSTLGLALLIPKASGYCMMQVFVMWVVVQGVGAADKVWDAALSYLNRGGVIVRPEDATNPGIQMIQAMNGAYAGGVYKGAAVILAGQVCMLGLQKQLTALRQELINKTDQMTGPCKDDVSSKLLCDKVVPDFINSVDVVKKQNAEIASFSQMAVQMPSFDEKPYSLFNGVCGTIRWDPLNKQLQASGVSEIMNSDEYKTVQLSRAIAIQQMYSDLASIAQVMVSNDPQIGTMNPPQPTDKDYKPYARQQFGVPLNQQGSICLLMNKVCTSWGAYLKDYGVLFNGTEFQGAVRDYNAIMAPTLSLILQSATPIRRDQNREFIKKASADGWIMAGAYFFDLVALNTRAMYAAQILQDKATGLDKSELPSVLVDKSRDYFVQLLVWFEGRADQMRSVIGAVDNLVFGQNLSLDFTLDPQRMVRTVESSTVYGFINNSLMMQMPGQPGVAPLRFADTLSFTPSPPPLYPKMAEKNYDGECSLYIDICDPIPFVASCGVCVGTEIEKMLYNGVLVNLVNKVLLAIYDFIQSMLNAVVWLPLSAIAAIFKHGLDLINAPGVNPIVAMANMGVMYINFAGALWISILLSSVIASIAPPIFALLMLALPLIVAWLGILLGIGMITAYYIPILPYMIFIFGAIGWVVTVIESMVAAPLVALGITHPEGHDALGKGEAALMILLNVFLRPSMMIIGYIGAIALAYVGIWILNTGFDHAISYMQGGELQSKQFVLFSDYQAMTTQGGGAQGSGSGDTKYNGWAGIFAYFFSILTYTTIYLIIVQKSFTLITHLPDKVLRWIGGSPESSGQESAQWGEEVKSGSKEAGTKAFDSQQQVGKSAGSATQKGASWAAGKKPKSKSGEISTSAQSSPSKEEK